MADGFDMRELDKFSKDLLSLANDKMPKESKKFLNKEGSKLNKQNKKTFESKCIDEKTGNLKKGFRKGKLYKYQGKDLSIRAYNSSPHAHLLNDGWIWTPHDGQSGSEKFIPGFHFVEDAANTFEGEYFADTEDFINDLLDKGL